MKNLLVNVPSIRQPIMPAPGFAKKGLADYKLDLMALCGFGCAYCSSNAGNYLRSRREEFADLTEEQIGKRLYPSTSPELTMLWPDVLTKLEEQLRRRDTMAALRGEPPWGTGQTLMFSMLTDGFSPILVGNGTTEAALRLVLKHSGFRVRVLTKNAVVGSDRWLNFFAEHPGRFVVGLSIGTLDAEWAQAVEVGTSSPQARVNATRHLQTAGVPTFGMLCPIFPDVLEDGGMEKLCASIRPEYCERIWAEPFNDRGNWRRVHDGYPDGSVGARRLRAIFGGEGARSESGEWSRYATDLYTRLRVQAGANGWLSKFSYLLYEDQIARDHAPFYSGLAGVLLQSKPDEHGFSPNPHIRKLQMRASDGRVP